MRILRHKVSPGSAGFTIHQGYKDAVEKDLNGQYLEWDAGCDDPDEIFEEFQPTLVYLDCRVKFKPPQYLNKRKCKIAISVDQLPIYGKDPIFPTLASEGYIADSDQIKWVASIEPDVVYHSNTQEVIEQSHAGWEELGYIVASIPLAGNIHKFNRHLNWENRIYDVGFVGGFWPYKAIGLFSYIMPCISYCNTAIIGSGWPVKVLANQVDHIELNQFWNYTKIAPSVQEPQVRFNYGSITGGEIASRVFDSSLSGAFVISDNPCGIKQIFGNTNVFPATINVDEFHYIIKSILSSKTDDILRIIDMQRDTIINGHLYKHRIESLLNVIN